MEKKNIDWGNLGFGYVKTDYRYVSNYKDGKWDEGGLTTDDMVTISECAGVLQYAQTVFEGMKAYTTEDGHIVTFRPDLNGDGYRMGIERIYSYERQNKKRSAGFASASGRNIAACFCGKMYL